MKKLFTILLLLVSFAVFSQPLSSEETFYFSSQMKTQEKSWNIGDLDGYMSYYWGSDSLLFIKNGKATKGWQNIRDNYEMVYLKSPMGTIEYGDLYFYKLNKKMIFCTGYRKIFQNDEYQSTFTLIWKKVKSKWVIIMDHSE